ncbi:MAG: hypothetical protein ACI867_002084 [Glaciecola sp.]|jgi:hypothetical protein
MQENDHTPTQGRGRGVAALKGEGAGGRLGVSRPLAK